MRNVLIFLINNHLLIKTKKILFNFLYLISLIILLNYL